MRTRIASLLILTFVSFELSGEQRIANSEKLPSSLTQIAPPATPLPATIKKIGEGVYASINPDGGKAGSNAGFVVGEDSVLVVDTHVNPDAARQLLAEIRKVTSLPVRYVVNTHYHLDHTGGNAVFAEAGATLLAQRNVRSWIRTESLKFFGATPTPEQKARVDAIALPQVTYGDGLDIYLGSRLVVLRSMPGHTGGDTAIFVPDANVIFGGDLIWNAHLPNLIDASTAPWITTLEMALSHHPNTTFVPGHGDVATAANVKDFHDYLVDLRAAITQARAAGKTGDDLTKAVTDQLTPKYGKWGFQRFMPLNIAQTAAELAGTKKVPQP
jgi:cyclase